MVVNDSAAEDTIIKGLVQKKAAGTATPDDLALLGRFQSQAYRDERTALAPAATAWNDSRRAGFTEKGEPKDGTYGTLFLPT